MSQRHNWPTEESGSAARQLMARGVNPVRLEGGEAIDALIGQIQHGLNHDPAPWMTRAQKAGAEKRPDRFETLLAESWDE